MLQTLRLIFFCQTPDNSQSETALSYWTMQRDWIKKIVFKRIGQNETGLIDFSPF